jgi:hypothetical protein
MLFRDLANRQILNEKFSISIFKCIHSSHAISQGRGIVNAVASG